MDELAESSEVGEWQINMEPKAAIQWASQFLEEDC